MNCGIWTFNLLGPFSTRFKGGLLTHRAACLAQTDDHNVAEAWKPHGIAADNAPLLTNEMISIPAAEGWLSETGTDHVPWAAMGEDSSEHCGETEGDFVEKLGI